MSADRKRGTDLATMADDFDARETSDRDEERCAYCGAVIDVTSWHPLVSRVEDGEVRLYPFCDVNCRDAWLDD